MITDHGVEAEVGHGGWPRRLATAVGHGGWPRRLATALAHSAWPWRLATKLGHGAWPQSLATELGHRAWPRTVATESHGIYSSHHHQDGKPETRRDSSNHISLSSPASHGIIGVWQGVAMDSLKFHPGPPYPTLVHPVYTLYTLWAVHP
jgi:hypothetical protein